MTQQNGWSKPKQKLKFRKLEEWLTDIIGEYAVKIK